MLNPLRSRGLNSPHWLELAAELLPPAAAALEPPPPKPRNPSRPLPPLLEPALVELEVWRVDRAREPACGTGNEVLRAVQRASESKMMRMAKALLSKSGSSNVIPRCC
jgi:hypothetical protein